MPFRIPLNGGSPSGNCYGFNQWVYSPDNKYSCKDESAINAVLTGIPSVALTVTKSGTGSGNVTPSTGTLTWVGNIGTASYTSGTSVTLTASAASGSTFAGWSGACSGTGTCTISMTQTRSVTATFNLSVSPPSTGLSASCSSSGTSATLSWNAVSGATYYPLRVDNTADGWDGSCSSAGGDFCKDVYATSYSFTSIPGATYKWWLHSCNANSCNWTTVFLGSNFTCAVSTSIENSKLEQMASVLQSIKAAHRRTDVSEKIEIKTR